MNDSIRIANLVTAVGDELAEKLAGLGPVAQSAILAELTSRYLAGHHPDLRDEVWRRYVKLTWELVPVNEGIMFGAAGHPGRQEHG